MRAFVHRRVHARHPGIEDADALAAFKATIRFVRRPNGQGGAAGLDGRGRLLEMEYAVNEAENEFLIFHAFTRPTSNVLGELGLS